MYAVCKPIKWKFNQNYKTKIIIKLRTHTHTGYRKLHYYSHKISTGETFCNKHKQIRCDLVTFNTVTMERNGRIESIKIRRENWPLSVQCCRQHDKLKFIQSEDWIYIGFRQWKYLCCKHTYLLYHPQTRW